MQRSIDINCDMGEWETSETAQTAQCTQSRAQSDLELMSFISSCSIACGGHSGDAQSMQTTLRNAVANGLRVGAHPAYPDKTDFGRRSLDLPLDALAASLELQISTLRAIAISEGAQLAFVKPHGALYNDMVRDSLLADTVIRTVKAIDPTLALMGLAGSHLKASCEAQGVRFIAEAFADRRYSDDGQLTPRNVPGAVIESPQAATQQIMSLLEHGSVVSINGKSIPLIADSICVHSDTPGAFEHVATINTLLHHRNIKVIAGR